MIADDPFLPSPPRQLSPTVAISGQIVDGLGLPVTGSVLIQAWPNPATEDAQIATAEQVDLLTLGLTQTDATGHFALELEFANLPPDYITEDRQVDMHLVAQAAGRHGVLGASVAHVDLDGMGPVWIDPVYRAAVTDAYAEGDPVATAEAEALAAKHVIIEVDQSGMAERWVDALPDVIDWGEVEPYIPPTSDTQGHGAGGCKMIKLADYQHGTKVSDTFPNGKSGVSATSYLSEGHSSGIGYGFKPASGSWSTKGHQSRSSEVTIQPSYSTANRYYKKTHLHRHYREDCVKPDYTGYVTYGYYYRSLYATGGATVATTSYKPSWSYCTTIPAGNWIRKSTNSYSHSGAVEAPVGAYFSAYSAWTSTHDLRYKTSSAIQLCGDNNYPSKSRRVATKP